MKPNELKWYIGKNGYFTHSYKIKGKSKKIYLHRFLLNAKKGEIIDHINGNKLDNRLENLRKVTPQQNAMNRKIASNNTSGIKGISWDKQAKKWKAYIKLNHKFITIGNFINKEKAIEVRKKAEDFYFGIYKYKGGAAL